jgi:UDPglucose--hexose-1-phosphate uridylyltransferase
VTTSHRRFNPLTGDWVLVSPHRLARPWLGRTEGVGAGRAPSYDPNCYLCPGNPRARDERNPMYERTFVFDNDFPALLPEAGEGLLQIADVDGRGLLVSHPEAGLCRVVCFSPRHDASLADLSPAEARAVIDVWVGQLEELGRTPWVKHVQIFENRGSAVGASNPHPHCQIWAQASLPNETAKELAGLVAYYSARGASLLGDYLDLELQAGVRLVCANDHFVTLVPFWAVWPFETLVVSRRHVTGLDQLRDDERAALAEILKRTTTRYDNLFKVSFPYTLGFHQRPTDGQAHFAAHFHAHFYPPLLRSATVRKFMVGYELLAQPQRDITPESAAERLRGVQED